MTKATDQAYDIIRQAILGGTFEPGDRLKEEKLVDLCGVSRTPVREALQRLAAENYLINKPNSGSQVADWSAREIEDIFALRATVEGMACARAAELITDEQIAILTEQYMIIDQMLEASTKPINTTVFLDANRIFHQTILEATGSEPMIQAVQRLISPPIVSRTACNYSKKDLKRSNAHHGELIEALSVRDSDWCGAIMRTHIRAAHSRFVNASNQS